LVEITRKANQPEQMQDLHVCIRFVFDLKNGDGEILDIEGGVRSNTAFIRNDLKIERFLVKAALKCGPTSPKVCK